MFTTGIKILNRDVVMHAPQYLRCWTETQTNTQDMSGTTTTTRLSSGVDPNVVEEPIRLRKVVWTVFHIIVATQRACAGLREGGTSPVATESGVKNNLVVLEVTRGTRRVRQLEARVRLAPIVWLRRLVVNILGNLVAREEESANELPRDPLSRVDATFACVETGPDRRTGAIDTTSLIGVLVRSIDRAVSGGRPTVSRNGPIARKRRCIFVRLAAAITGVQRGQADVLVVDVLDNVNLAVIGPIWTNHPERWPQATTARETSRRGRHVLGINDDEVVAIEGFV